MQTFNGDKETDTVESEGSPSEDAHAVSMVEAEGILTALASVFFPNDSATSTSDTIEKLNGETIEAAETPNLEARYRILVEQIPAVVFMAFLDKGVSEAYVSPQIEAILGFTQEEWLNDPVRWYQQVHPADKARWSIEAAQMFLSGQPLRSVYRVIARDGHVVWFHCEARMIRRDDGRPWFIHGVGFDITELKQAEESLRNARDELEMRVQARTAELARANTELQLEIAERTRAEAERAEMLAREQEARKQAEEANRLKDEFLATVSHELRTPLTAVLGWAHMLRANQLDQTAREHALEIIERNARAQNQLIDDLLDMSRIITGNLRLDVRPVAPASFIESAIESVRPAAKAKGIRLQELFDTEVSSVSGDPARLQQVVWNLLSNAIKFTPHGGRVQVRLERSGSYIEIAVSDNGDGIKAEFLPFVFDRFRQADGTMTRQHGGLGLGLAIVRQLVELHGGTVEANSPGEGKGATFTVRLPLMPLHHLETRAERDRLAASDTHSTFGRSDNLAGLTVLVVDDEDDVLELIKALLGGCGAKVLTAQSAAAAFDLLERLRPDVIICDIGMPDEDGFEFIQKVRALPVERGGRIPAVALTAYARAEDRLRVLRSGYQMHIAKPMELAELVAVVANVAGRA
ncbi:MAG: ATP-binding protein [Pyrinomonadaceae bacterium]